MLCWVAVGLGHCCGRGGVQGVGEKQRLYGAVFTIYIVGPVKNNPPNPCRAMVLHGGFQAAGKGRRRCWRGAESCRVFSSQGLMHSSGPVGRHRHLILVLEGELYLIPFALLKGSSSNEYLYERFSLIAVPSIRSLNPSSKVLHRPPAPAEQGSVCIAQRSPALLCPALSQFAAPRRPPGIAASPRCIG